MMAHRNTHWGLLHWSVTVGGMVIIGVLLAIGVNDVQGTQDDLEQTQTRLDQQEQVSTILARQVKRLGGEPVISPDDLPEPEPGEQGTRGPSGPPPSPEAVAEAVHRYCANVGCQGRRGPRGAGVTPSEVAAAVANYCNARGECSGPVGPEGGVGPAGPAPTAEQIAQAVSDYCASRNGCSGPRGDPGRPPTEQEIAGAVAAYCAAHDTCRGPQGEPGSICPDGWHTETVTVVTTGEGTRDILACVVNE